MQFFGEGNNKNINLQCQEESLCTLELRENIIYHNVFSRKNQSTQSFKGSCPHFNDNSSKHLLP